MLILLQTFPNPEGKTNEVANWLQSVGHDDIEARAESCTHLSGFHEFQPIWLCCWKEGPCYWTCRTARPTPTRLAKTYTTFCNKAWSPCSLWNTGEVVKGRGGKREEEEEKEHWAPDTGYIHGGKRCYTEDWGRPTVFVGEERLDRSNEHHADHHDGKEGDGIACHPEHKEVEW